MSSPTIITPAITPPRIGQLIAVGGGWDGSGGPGGSAGGEEGDAGGDGGGGEGDAVSLTTNEPDRPFIFTV